MADRQPDAASVLPRVAASLALLFAGGILAVLMLEIASAPAPVRLIEHVDMLAAVLAAVLVGLGLWRHSPWGWWIGLLGGSAVVVQVALQVNREVQFAPGPALWFSGVLAVAFLAVLLAAADRPSFCALTLSLSNH